jgi:uncharacterized protein YcbK (DUF882 family)
MCFEFSFFRRVGLLLAAAIASLVAIPSATQDAVANGDTRTLDLVHMHTKESKRITFRRNGRYDADALKQLNWFLRDWRHDESTDMDPRLFDTVWEVTRSLDAQEPIHIVSAYRSPRTNSMLRGRSRGVAKHSQHMLGKAMDFYIPGVPVERVRALGMQLQRGGVGYYPSSYTPFVHLDVGSVRAWPRMSRDQLVRLFPNEQTVHLPRSGPPLAGYETAKAMILARGGVVGGEGGGTEVAEAETDTPTQSLWSRLFGRGDQPSAPSLREPRTRVAAIDREEAITSDEPTGLAGGVVAAPTPRAALGAIRTTTIPPAPVLASPKEATQRADVPVPTSRPVVVAALTPPMAVKAEPKPDSSEPNFVWSRGADPAQKVEEDAEETVEDVDIPLPTPRPSATPGTPLVASVAPAALMKVDVPLPLFRPNGSLLSGTVVAARTAPLEKSNAVLPSSPVPLPRPRPNLTSSLTPSATVRMTVDNGARDPVTTSALPTPAPAKPVVGSFSKATAPAQTTFSFAPRL